MERTIPIRKRAAFLEELERRLKKPGYRYSLPSLGGGTGVFVFEHDGMKAVIKRLLADTDPDAYAAFYRAYRKEMREGGIKPTLYKLDKIIVYGTTSKAADGYKYLVMRHAGEYDESFHLAAHGRNNEHAALAALNELTTHAGIVSRKHGVETPQLHDCIARRGAGGRWHFTFPQDYL